MFAGTNIQPFENKIWLATPTMHKEELEYIHEAFDKNWITTAGENITSLEDAVSNFMGGGKDEKKQLYCVGLSSGTAAIHLALKLAGLTTNPTARFTDGLLRNQHVFVSDMTFNASVNPIVYEGGIPVFIDSEAETWNMDPEALERAFQLYPNVKVVIVADLYGTPADLPRIRSICDKHGAVLIEDAAESLGATIEGRKTGTFGDYTILSFNGNKIITGSSGGMLLCFDRLAADRVRKWSTQAREAAPWYQHEELGYNYRISNIIAGIARGQMLHIGEHIARKRMIYERYREGFKDLPVKMNSYLPNTTPNFWLSCLLIDRSAMCKQVRSEHDVLYTPEAGRSCPTEILEVLARHNAEGRPIWKPIHLQPLYRSNGFITAMGNGRAQTDAYINHTVSIVDEDVFERGLCLPSDIKMNESEQDKVIEIIKNCFS